MDSAKISPADQFKSYLEKADQQLTPIQEDPLNLIKVLDKLVKVMDYIKTQNDYTILDKNVVLLSTFLKKHTFYALNNEQFAIKVEEIKNAIFSRKNDNGRFYIHQLARDGNYEGVKALVRLAPDVIFSKSDSGRTPSGYVLAYQSSNSQGLNISAYLQIFNATALTNPPLIDFDRLNDIVCNKGTSLEGFERNESLILRMQAVRLKFFRKVPYGDVNYYFTQVFSYIDRFGNKPLTFCLVEKFRKLYPRLYWFSGSQAIWRNTDKIFNNWIGKSARGEQSLALPLEVNRAAYQIYNNSSAITDLDKEKGREFLQHTIGWSDHDIAGKVIIEGLPFLKCKDDPSHYTPVEEDSPEADEYQETKLGMPGLLMDPKAKIPAHPNQNDFTSFLERPNFDLCVDTYNFTSRIYGPLVAKTFFSRNNKIKYLFLEIIQGKETYVFLAAAECIEAPVTKYGIKKHYPNLGALALPFFEYRSQFIESFLTKIDKEQPGKYVCTWNYLRQMPVIIEYYRKRYHSAPPPAMV